MPHIIQVTKPHPQLEAILDAYMECAEWSSLHYPEGDDVDPVPFDSVDNDGWSEALLTASRNDIDEFTRDNGADLEGMAPGQIGHDFWLTRNGHGAGFWDRGLGARGDRLTKACKTYGEVNLYIGDDGLVHA